LSLMVNADYFDVFIKKGNNKWVHYRSGILQEWDKKDGLRSAGNRNTGAIPFILTPGEQVIIYNRINRDDKTNFITSITLYNTDKLIKDQYINYVDARSNYFSFLHLQDAYILGILLLTIFFNLFFFKVVHDKVNLYFALYAFFLGINRLYEIFDSYFSWEHPSMVYYIHYLGYAWTFITYFLIQFIREFFQTKIYYKHWDRWLSGLAIFSLFLLIVRLFSEFFLTKMFTISFSINSLFLFYFVPLNILITLLLFIRKKNKSIRLFIIGILPLNLLYLVPTPQDLPSIHIGVPLFVQIVNMNYRIIEVSCVTWFILFFSWILFIRYDNLRKENSQRALDNERLAKEREIERGELIEKQKEELEGQVIERTADLNKSLIALRAAQSQLIQSEKMASLGELTAGIAHEIQNPLNFVNNFSDVNKELLTEMKDELDKGNVGEVKAIANDVIENEGKINLHGKRADAIVKSMLQHSKVNSGQKEMTNINALADEYIRLAYHGFRSKDKSFNAEIVTNFDPRLPEINVISQDIGRVLLNLFNNSFYAVQQKNKTAVADYKPEVSVTTYRENGKVIIKVKDNGMGIPDNIKDKIMQPFFTTKPTGEGTGLGLSLSYDIVVKGHGGSINVISNTGEGSEFSIILPL
jgi:two-component system NtrC family sensor kinase